MKVSSQHTKDAFIGHCIPMGEWGKDDGKTIASLVSYSIINMYVLL